MRRAMRLAMATLSLALAAGCATDRRMGGEDAVLFKARIASQKFLAPLEAKPGQVALGGYDMLAITTEEFFIGRPEKVSSIVVTMADSPDLDVLDEILVLGRFSNDGEFHVVQWNFARAGLCVTPKTASELRIETQLAELYGNGRLHCAS